MSITLKAQGNSSNEKRNKNYIIRMNIFLIERISYDCENGTTRSWHDYGRNAECFYREHSTNTVTAWRGTFHPHTKSALYVNQAKIYPLMHFLSEALTAFTSSGILFHRNLALQLLRIKEKKITSQIIQKPPKIWFFEANLRGTTFAYNCCMQSAYTILTTWLQLPYRIVVRFWTVVAVL